MTCDQIQAVLPGEPTVARCRSRVRPEGQRNQRPDSRLCPSSPQAEDGGQDTNAVTERGPLVNAARAMSSRSCLTTTRSMRTVATAPKSRPIGVERKVSRPLGHSTTVDRGTAGRPLGPRPPPSPTGPHSGAGDRRSGQVSICGASWGVGPKETRWMRVGLSIGRATPPDGPPWVGSGRSCQPEPSRR